MENTYRPTIGLEIHAELKTRTKMFCNSKNDPDEIRPNFNICPICMGHPGTLPVINKEAVRHVLRVGLAVGAKLADYTEFDRKNYFYPDIPKGYQISQYKYPLVQGGSIRDVQITRIHLEEDTARSSHDTGEYSLVDFNRSGVPLMELVTEPVIHDAQSASAFARELQLLLRYLGASEANMEKGEMRVEANVSVSKDTNFGTKVEIKNLNSFKSVERAIAYEIKRQVDLLEKGGTVVQETRGWDDAGQKTFSQRMKEESHDYRYFPDPDLPKLRLSSITEFDSSRLNEMLVELPWNRRSRIIEVYGLKADAAEILVQDLLIAKLFDDVARLFGEDKESVHLTANYLTSDVVGLVRAGDSANLDNLNPESFAKLIHMIQKGVLSSRGAKDVLAFMMKQGGDPELIATTQGLIQENNTEATDTLVEEVLSEHKTVAEEYKNGKESSLQFLIGQAMKRSKGSANPQLLQAAIRERLK